MRLDGRVAIVTGGARGIGRAYALGLAREGASVAIADLLDGGPVVDEINAAGGKAIALRADVSDEASTLEMARRTLEAFGRVDALVNNAARYVGLGRKPWHKLSVQEWDSVMAVNVRGLLLCSRAVFPAMRHQGYGKIINIASNTVFRGSVGMIHYVTSKAAVVGFTRALAREVGEHGIRVNAVAPDYIPHERDRLEQPEVDAQTIALRCLKRTEVPEDVVGTVVFLASAESDFITGQTISVNGGSSFL